MSEETNVTCPHCNGKGKDLIFTTRNMSGQMTPCTTCGATGIITVEHMKRITKGKAMRDDRVARMLSQREEAARLGIDPMALNDMERGREPRQ